MICVCWDMVALVGFLHYPNLAEEGVSPKHGLSKANGPLYMIFTT